MLWDLCKLDGLMKNYFKIRILTLVVFFLIKNKSKLLNLYSNNQNLLPRHSLYLLLFLLPLCTGTLFHNLLFHYQNISFFISNFPNPVGWGSRTQWQHLCRGLRLPAQNRYFGYSTQLRLILKLQTWNFDKFGEHIHYHYFIQSSCTFQAQPVRVHSIRSGSAW